MNTLFALHPDPSSILEAMGMMVLGTMTPFPAEVAALGVAMKHGFWVALALIWSGAMVGAVLSYWLARLVRMRDWLMRFAPVRRAVARLDRLGWVGVTGLRMIPLIPFFALSLAAGLVHLPFAAYLGGTALGIMPASLILAMLGRGLISDDAGIVVVSVLAIAALCGLAWCFRRQG